MPGYYEELNYAVNLLKKAGYTVTKNKRWYINAYGDVIDKVDVGFPEESRKFLGSYATKGEAESARDGIRKGWGDNE